MILRTLLFAFATLCAFRSHAALVTSFATGSGGWQLSSPAVANLDADAQLEIVTAYRNSSGQWLLDAHKPSGARLPGFPYNAGQSPINVSPTLANVDADAALEIVFTAGNQIIALDPSGSVLWRHTISYLNYVPTAGFMAATNGFYVSPLGLFQPLLLPTAAFYSEVSSPMVVDLEGDGSLEVLTAWKIDPDTLSAAQDYNPLVNDIFGVTEWGLTGEVWSGGVIVSDARTGATKFIYHFHQLVEAGLALAQLDHDPAIEVLVLNDADSIAAFDLTQPPGLLGKGMLHKKFGKNLRFLSGSYQTGVDLHAADIDGDGLDEVLVSSTRINPNWTPSETLLDDDGSILWRDWLTTPVSQNNQNGWFNSATLIPVNPDNDHRIDLLGFNHSSELSFRFWNGLEFVSHSGWPKSFAPEFPSPPVVGDIDGDGAQEIIFTTYDPARNPSVGKLYVLNLNGTQQEAITIPTGAKQIPVLADTNADGKLDVVVRALDGRIYIYNFGNGTLPLWSAHQGSASRLGSFGRSLYPNGTPIVTNRTSALTALTLGWKIPAGFQPTGFKIFRAPAGGTFTEIASLSASTRTYTDPAVAPGQLYLYEIAALYPNATVRSAPMALACELNANLVVNGSFESDDDRGWDKWFSGDIPIENMRGSSNARSGARSMEIRLQNHGNNSSITQYSHFAISEDYLPVTPGKLYSYGGFIKGAGLNTASSHWLEWDSSLTAFDTNRRPNLPWPDYFTPSVQTSATLGTAWTYLNRVFPMPAGFPNVQLRHRMQAASGVTGSIFIDDVFFRELPAPNDSRWANLITLGSRWRHLPSAAPANWFTESFQDNTWTEAPAKFGQGTGPQNIRTVVPKNQPAYHFRQKFTLSNPNVSELLLTAYCTDDYGGTVYPMRLWLNGQPIPADIHAVSGEGNVVKYFDLTPFRHLLKSGQNLAAFQLGNTWQPTWDNVAFDVSIRAILAPPAATSSKIDSVRRLNATTAELTLSATRPSTWTLQFSSSLLPNSWQTVQTVAFASAGTQNVNVPTPAPIRYFRLVAN